MDFLCETDLRSLFSLFWREKPRHFAHSFKRRMYRGTQDTATDGPKWRNGRRRGFKIPRREACRFESGLGYQLCYRNKINYLFRFLGLRAFYSFCWHRIPFNFPSNSVHFVFRFSIRSRAFMTTKAFAFYWTELVYCCTVRTVWPVIAPISSSVQPASANSHAA